MIYYVIACGMECHVMIPQHGIRHVDAGSNQRRCKSQQNRKDHREGEYPMQTQRITAVSAQMNSQPSGGSVITPACRCANPIHY
jgi:hypothetical protein